MSHGRCQSPQPCCSSATVRGRQRERGVKIQQSVCMLLQTGASKAQWLLRLGFDEADHSRPVRIRKHTNPCFRQNAGQTSTSPSLSPPSLIPPHPSHLSLTGISSAHSSPPSLQLSCRATLVVTLIIVCFLLSVRPSRHWEGTE